jgi:hypothetical protein
VKCAYSKSMLHERLEVVVQLLIFALVHLGNFDNFL